MLLEYGEHHKIMPKPREIDNIAPFPNPHPQLPGKIEDNGEAEGEQPMVSIPAKRAKFLTPFDPSTVSFKPPKDRSVPRKKSPKVWGGSHASRSNKLSYLFLAFASILLVGMVIFLKVTIVDAVPKKPEPVKATSASMGFYEGNHVFNKTLDEEKQAKLMEQQHEVHGLSAVDEDLEISLHQQMTSMSEKVEQMRAEKMHGEDPPPAPDQGSPPELVVPVKPTKTEDFQAPLQFSKELPKGLQTNQ